jgi:hypothetical protein
LTNTWPASPKLVLSNASKPTVIAAAEVSEVTSTLAPPVVGARFTVGFVRYVVELVAMF